jgi:tetratricopeptide (TPR) repeat protein
MLRKSDERRLQTAYLLHQQGDFGQAAKLYRELIDRNPHNFHALHFLGLIEASSGNLQQAKPLMARSIRIQPANIQFIENYAAVLAQLQDYEGALQVCENGLKINPDNISLLYISAGALLKLEKFSDSLARFDKVLQLKSNHVAALAERAVVHTQMKNYDPAIADAKKALSIDPNYADAHLNLAMIYSTLSYYDEAITEFNKALATNPRLANAWFGRGKAFQEMNRAAEALSDYEKGLAFEPDKAEAHDWKGAALLELGRFAESNIAIERAIDLAPKRGSFYFTLAFSKKFSPGDRRLQSMEELAQEMPSLPTDEQVCLHFALAKALQDIGDHERSFQHFLDGNALKRKHLPYEEAATLEILARTRRAYTAEVLRDHRGRGDPSALPVFIVGMPRSGSTLVEQILASHPQVYGAGEIADLHHCVTDLRGPAEEARYSPEAVSRASDEDFARLGASYVDRIRRLAPAATRITNKTTENFRLAGLINLALPNARIIHTRRDPIDTCLSCFSHLFGEHLPYTFDLGELGRYYCAYEDVMAHWRIALPQNLMLEVQYEEVVADLETQARRIVAHCGLDWDSRCLDFHQTARPIRTSSVTQVRQPIYKSAVGRWRAYEKHLKPLLAELEKRV